MWFLCIVPHQHSSTSAIRSFRDPRSFRVLVAFYTLIRPPRDSGPVRPKEMPKPSLLVLLQAWSWATAGIMSRLVLPSTFRISIALIWLLCSLVRVEDSEEYHATGRSTRLWTTAIVALLTPCSRTFLLLLPVLFHLYNQHP